MAKVEDLQEVNPEQQQSALAARIAASEREVATDRKFAREGEIFEISTVETRVLQLQQIAGQSIVEIGRLLAWMKERAGHGQYMDSLKRMGIHERTARHYVQVFDKLSKISNRKPVSDLGIAKALELIRNYEDEELEALADGQEVDGHTLDELRGLSRTELKATIRRERSESGKKIEAAQKQADALQVRNNKLAQQMESCESGSDGGWEFTAQQLEHMGAKMRQIQAAAMELESLSEAWAELVESGDERALTGHPFILSNLVFFQNLVITAIDQCDGALQRAMAVDHPQLQFPSGTQYAPLGFTRNNLPKSMEFTPRAVEEAEPQVDGFDGFQEAKANLF